MVERSGCGAPETWGSSNPGSTIGDGPGFLTGAAYGANAGSDAGAVHQASGDSNQGAGGGGETAGGETADGIISFASPKMDGC